MDETIEAASEKYQGLVPLVYDIEMMDLDEARPQDMPYAVYLKREADKIIADKDTEIRRLKRALYKACANWAMAESYSVLNDVPTANRWVHTLRKLEAKLEQYK